ncbi:Rho termination factor N-terminal domain-containing protein [Clostridium niameyense]|uniref:Rho termination factor N-terminal domain-containing protein n=1 Tax=Clostridium niameyense TaxID=1622073 RepID=UPI00067F2B66|nr:Rho termination factor N-terminal domain-containing protein [Clostridium niameyense]
MKKYTNGKREIIATERAFEILYKDQGFKEIEEHEETTQGDEEINLEDLTVKELKEKCEELRLEDYKNLKKEELIELLKGVN